MHPHAAPFLRFAEAENVEMNRTGAKNVMAILAA